MAKFEVSNETSGICFGVYEADTEEDAIEAVCIDAGYDGIEDAEEVTGQQNDLIATEVEEWEAWLDDIDNRATFYVPKAGTVDVAAVGAEALGVDACEELNVARVQCTS